MKKLLRISTIGAIIAPVTTLIACGADADFEVIPKVVKNKFEGTKVINKRLAAIVTDPENPRWQKARQELEQAGKAVGFKTKTQILKKQKDQNDWINIQLLNNVDVLILGTTDHSVAGTFLTAAKKNVPVIAYDKLIIGTSPVYNWYVSFDNAKVGHLQGLKLIQEIYGARNVFASVEEMEKYVKEHPLSKPKIILMLAGAPTDNNAKLFFSGAKNVIDKAIRVQRTIAGKKGNLKIEGPQTFSKVAQDNWDYAKGKTFLDIQIQKLGKNKSKLAGILSPNDGMATGAAIPALKNAKLDPKNIYITGLDANDTSIVSIFNETGQNMTIFKPDSKAARIAVAMAAKLTKNANATLKEMADYLKKAYPSIKFRTTDNEYYADDKKAKAIKSIVLEPTVIDKNNLNDFFTVTKK